MSEENRTSTGGLVEFGDAHSLGESVSDGEENLRPQLRDRRMTSSEINRRINAIVVPLSTQVEMLTQLVRELNERNSTRSSEGKVACDRSRSSSHRCDTRCVVQLDLCFCSYQSNFHLRRHQNGILIYFPQWTRCPLHEDFRLKTYLRN